MAVEHAPRDRRGRAGAFPQLGVPLGMLLASGVTALMTGVVSPGPAFLEWGWRVPFLLSVVLIGVGYVVRRSVDESPVFAEMAEKKQRTKVPVVELFRRHWLLVVLAALVFAGNNAAGYTLFTFGLGLAYGPQAAWYSEIFPASVRFSGWRSPTPWAPSSGVRSSRPSRRCWCSRRGASSRWGYLLGMFVVAVAATALLRDRTGIDLGAENQAEQEVGATVLTARPLPGTVPTRT